MLSWMVRTPRPVAALFSPIAPEPETRVRLKALPVTAPWKVMSPAPVPVLTATLPVRLTGPVKVTLSLVVVTSPALLMAEPVRETVPPERMSPAAAMFSVPLALAEKAPLVGVVVIWASMAMLPPDTKARFVKLEPLVTLEETTTPPVLEVDPTCRVAPVSRFSSAWEMPSVPVASAPPRLTTVPAE